MPGKGVLPLALAEGEGEVALLRRAQGLGLPVAPTWVVRLEEEFYRLNNLKERLEDLFLGVFGVRIDEERLLWAAEEARRAVRESYLLPERAEAFLEALKGRGPFLLRYAGEAEGERASTPQEALFALKRLWTRRFAVEAVLERYPALLPPFTPVLVQEVAGEVAEDPFLSLDLSRALGRGVVAYAWGGKLVRVESPHGG
ncbi:hypothetical protein TTMY_1667 [Thermus thermophilus]|uniref:hypothetical protein n=1 Tax=Thermus thermophilus TaxID=274 RepID=UPI000909BEE1|nr:hypothetical protein [Thermus thermophilus]BAW02044.1 hypothetical protein TTMY_1667 [Thermus thermophilus]BDB10309.1 hypothetical protein TthTMY_00480 [Thermus thermophilus]